MAFHILLVEDNPADAALIRLMLEEHGLPHTLHVVEDGATALEFLHGRGGHRGAPRPDLVLLDLNLPVVSGRRVLEGIKADPDLLTIPVVVFSSSRSSEDVEHCYFTHANCYVQKPVELEGYGSVIRSLRRFWFNTVQLPPSGYPTTAGKSH